MEFLAPRETTGDGLVIRAYRAGDGGELARAVNASYEHLRPWMVWARPDNTEAGSEDLISTFEAKYAANEDYALGIWDGGTLIGGTGFHLRWGPVTSQVAEIGMWVAGDRVGQGVATRALRLLLDWGFGSEWGFRRLVWLCLRENEASARVAIKGGMLHEGCLRQMVARVDGGYGDADVFAILASDPRPYFETASPRS